MFYLLKFINKTYWKSIILPVMSFIFPLLYVAIIGGIYNILGQVTPSIILPAAWSIGIMITTMICIPQMIFEMRQSIIIKRLGVSKYKPWMFYLLIILFFVLVNFVSYACIIAVSYLVLIGNWIFVTELLMFAHYGEVAFSLFISFVMGLSIGLFFVSIFKSVLQIQIVGFILVIISLILSGMMVPMAMTYTMNASYRILSFISPFTYTNSLLTESWFHYQYDFNVYQSSIFSPGDVYMTSFVNSYGSATVAFTTWQKWMNILIPPFLTVFFTIFSLSKLSFSTR